MENFLSNKYLPNSEDVPFLEPSTSFGLLKVWKKYGHDESIATFDLYVRDMPKNRNFLVFTGLEEIVDFIMNWKYSPNHLLALEKFGFLDEETKNFLQKFRFTGSLYAMKEGSIFYAGEPVVKIIAPLKEAALLYNFLVNTLCSNTIFSSKSVRSRLVSSNKKLVTGAIRGHAMEALLKFMRASYIVGFDLSVAPVMVGKYGIEYPKLLKSTHHHYVKSFPTEIEAFRAITDIYPDNEVTLIVDTYDIKRGIENAISVCKELKQKGKGIHSIFIDSGDLGKYAKYARRRLDLAGFEKVQILVASDLNEEKIEKLVKDNTPIDSFMLATELVTSADDPRLEAVYKMAEIEENGNVRPTAKFSMAKQSLPGNKQVYRFYKNGKMDKDIVSLVSEDFDGEALLLPIIEKGKLIYNLPSILEIRNYFSLQLEKLPENLKKLRKQKKYSVTISNGLKRMVKTVKAMQRSLK